MRVDEGGYWPKPAAPKPRPAAPKPKPRTYRPASRPPGVAAPYRPKQKTTTPLRPANFSTITASARSRVGNIYAPGAGTPYARPTYGPVPAPQRPAVPGTMGTTKNYDPLMNALAGGVAASAATTPALAPLLATYLTGQGQPAQAQAPKGGKAGSGRSGYAPRAYYGGGGGYSGGGGGGGGGGGSQFERYGMSKDWMQAYKAFWGHAMPTDAWGMFSPVQQMFTNLQGRMPQLDDWQRIWQAAKDYLTTAGKDAKNMPKNLALYEPWSAQGVRPPLFTPPTTSYAPFLSF